MKKALFKITSSGVVLIGLLGFFIVVESVQQVKYPLETGPLEPGLKELAQSKISMVSAAHPFGTQAGLEMLRRGGNAMDAAIAATMVTTVVDVGMSSFAGGGELTYYDAKTEKTIALQFYLKGVKDDVMPFTTERDGTTGRAIGIPGSIAGFYQAIQKFGALPWKEVMEPAIFYAENGYPIYGGAYIINSERYAALTLRPNARRLYAPNGFLPPYGSIFKQPELAETLKKIAEHGADYFYKGPFTKQMVKAIQDIGGKATLEDFASYDVLESEPVRGFYKDYEIVGPPLPAWGTTAIIEAMNLLQDVDLKGMGHYTQSADSLQWFVETARVIFSDTRKYIGVPELDNLIARALMSKEYAAAQSKLIRHKIDLLRRQAAKKEISGVLPEPAGNASDEVEHTEHVATVDKDGNVCSITHTISGPIYSNHGLFVGGIVMNATRDHTGQPGGRMLNPLAPVIVFKGGKPYFATGSSGGVPNTFYTTLNVLAWDKSLKEAQEAPRLRSTALQERDSLAISIENRIDEKVAEQMKRRGYQFEWLGPYGGPSWLGGAQMIGIDPTTGIRLGATDPRGIGQAEGQK